MLDSRTVEEFNRFHVPGAVTCPGAELVHRFEDLVPDRETLVVVSCAGRTRSIIGAQSLINAGVPNKVVSLEGGTQAGGSAGWSSNATPRRRSAPVSKPAAAAARQRGRCRQAVRGAPDRSRDAGRMAGRSRRRTTYLLDVRTPEEYAAGHLPGSVSAEGGQLVQAIDRWVGIRGARLVLVDDTGMRAVMTAQWLLQMGWDAVVLDRPVNRDRRRPSPAGGSRRPAAPRCVGIGAAEAAHWLNEGDAAAVAIMPSARISPRPSRGRGVVDPSASRSPAGSVLRASRILVFADDPAVGALAAADLAEIAPGAVALVQGGIEAWRAAGHPFAASPDDPPDTDRIDYVFWNHDRHAGNQEAMRAYLRWETELPGEIARDGLAGFRLAAV